MRVAFWLCSLGLLFVGGISKAETSNQPMTGLSQAPSAGLDRAKHRLYLGGRDEQNLEIQPSLPQPARSLTGTVAPSISTNTDEEPAEESEAPATD